MLKQNVTFKYQQLKTFADRKNESSKILQKYPDRIPVIIEKSKDSDISEIDKSKFLIPSSLTIGNLIYVIRKRIKLKPEKAIFFFINDTIPNTSATIIEVYNQFKNEDGFLYVNFSSENTFG